MNKTTLDASVGDVTNLDDTDNTSQVPGFPCGQGRGPAGPSFTSTQQDNQSSLSGSFSLSQGTQGPPQDDQESDSDSDDDEFSLSSKELKKKRQKERK